ncbi:MAG: hypothetical protein Kow0098_22440 [Ignavibacteriaceae bacterium]
MKNKINFIILFIPLIFLSCQNSNAPEKNILYTPELLPLNTGNYWIYSVGIKDSYDDTTYSFKDTLKVISENDSGFFLKSSSGLILPDGYYLNKNDGLYSGNRLQFKYPGSIGEYCGEMGLVGLINSVGEKPSGIIDRINYSFTSTNFSGGSVTFSDCYYYFLAGFYIVPEIKTTGYTVFKPGVGIVQLDWTDINEVLNEFHNPYAVLIEYSITD